MSRTVRDARIDNRSNRAKLKAAGKPYYRAIDPGLHLGYRKGVSGGKWVVRLYVGDETYKVATIGTADDKADADGVAILDYRQAQALAREKAVELARQAAGLPEAPDAPYTVKACIDDYIAWLEEHRKTARDARWRADALILPELGEKLCSDLTPKMIRDWLSKVAETAPRLRVKKGNAVRYREIGADDPEDQRRRRASGNRVLTILKAALNRAWREEKIASDAAWRKVEPFEAADAARVRYLTLAECKRLINAAQGDFRALVRVALATGARYGEVAALRVGDYNPDAGTLQILISKSGKSRHVVLNDEGRSLLDTLTAGRPAEALLLTKDGSAWTKSLQARPMLEACKAAKITPAIGIHGLRHTYASLSVMAGAPLLVLAKNLGHADTRMIEKHYSHLSPTYIAEAIRAAAPSFGIALDDRVRRAR